MTAKNPIMTDANIAQIAWMHDFLVENDRLPNRREMAEHYGWRSINAAQEIYDKLEKLKVIERNGVADYRFVRF